MRTAPENDPRGGSNAAGRGRRHRVVAANQRPDHATLARFRRRHQGAIATLFGQVLALCVRAGLVDAGVVAIDGTKIAANASFFANRDHADLSAELAGSVGCGPTAAAARRVAGRVLAEAEQVDAAEDEQSVSGAVTDARQGGPVDRIGGRGSGLRSTELDRQKSRDYRDADGRAGSRRRPRPAAS